MHKLMNLYGYETQGATTVDLTSPRRSTSAGHANETTPARFGMLADGVWEAR
jgi:hypothetical protein